MTTNTLLSMDVVASPDLPQVRPVPVLPEQKKQPPASRQGRAAWRPILGGYLLNLPRLAWMLLDVALVCGGSALGDRLFVWWVDSTSLLTAYNVWIANVVLASAVIIAGSIIGLYESTTLWARSRIVARCLLTVTLAMLATWVIMHLFMYSSLSRRVAASGIIFFLLTASAVRLLAHRAIREVQRGLLVIGQGPLTGSIIRSVRRGSVPGYRLVGLVVPNKVTSKRGGFVEDRDDAGAQGVSDIPIVGEIGDVEGLCREFNVAEVVVADTAVRNPQFLRAALACLRLGCRVTDETTFYESTYGEIPVSHITPRWFLAADLKGQREEHAVTKRIFDVVVAAIALVVLAPLLSVVAAAIRLGSPRIRIRGAWVRVPVLYTQTRVGRGGRPFTLYKFRTMYGDAESNGSTWAKPNDPRVTRIGRFLRRSRLDELPQLWNILKGDMSVVGPRPERPEFVRPLTSLIPFYDERHLIKPGLTGWAQINYTYGSSIADARRKLQLDLYYVKHTSLELDLVILLRTLGTFFLGSR